MSDFSDFIEDMELGDPELIGGESHGGEVTDIVVLQDRIEFCFQKNGMPASGKLDRVRHKG